MNWNLIITSSLGMMPFSPDSALILFTVTFLCSYYSLVRFWKVAAMNYLPDVSYLKWGNVYMRPNYLQKSLRTSFVSPGYCVLSPCRLINISLVISKFLVKNFLTSANSSSSLIKFSALQCRKSFSSRDSLIVLEESGIQAANTLVFLLKATSTFFLTPKTLKKSGIFSCLGLTMKV